MYIDGLCPNCAAEGMRVIYSIEQVPVHSVQLLHSRQQALDYPRGDITLAFCDTCGFISNVAYDYSLQDYSVEYEATQSCSPTFNSFAYKLADRLVKDYHLQEKDIIEIGCGQGEFLSVLCELGNNRGVGFDPAYLPEKDVTGGDQRIQFIQDYYSEEYSDYKADFVVCKMTLEHINPPIDMVATVRRSLGDRKDTIVFFQVPDVLRVLSDIAFWDIYYEHCSYFSAGSLARLFRKAGFEVVNLAREYDDQYIMIEARPANAAAAEVLAAENDLEDLRRAVDRFAETIPIELAAWRDRIQNYSAQGKKVVLWGGGSKGVAFLTTLGIYEQIEYVVDINPRKHGTFMGGTGQEVVNPEFLVEYRPDVVIVMNPIYCTEIKHSLNQIGLDPELISV